MKMFSRFFLSAIAILLCSQQVVIAAEDYKIGAVQALRVLEQSPQAEAARKKIEREFSPREKELIAQQKKIKALEDRLAKDGAIMSESELKNLERDVISKKRELRRSQDEFREDFNFRNNEELAKIQKEIIEAIKKIAVDQKFDVILSDGVLYASPKVDITQQVIDAMKGGQ